MEKVLQGMATNVSPLLNIWAPKAFENMVSFTLPGSVLLIILHNDLCH